MKKIIYLGMQNEPIEVVETVIIENFKVVYEWRNIEGKVIKLQTIKECLAYYPPSNHVLYKNPMLPTLPAGKIYPVSILDKGYDSHCFTAIAV